MKNIYINDNIWVQPIKYKLSIGDRVLVKKYMSSLDGIMYVCYYYYKLTEKGLIKKYSNTLLGKPLIKFVSINYMPTLYESHTLNV